MLIVDHWTKNALSFQLGAFFCSYRANYKFKKKFNRIGVILSFYTFIVVLNDKIWYCWSTRMVDLSENIIETELKSAKEVWKGF